MSNNKSISIIICTWNRSDLLRDTLKSLNGQMDVEQLNVEVIVVDNNSADDTRAAVEAAKLNWSLGELRYAFEPRQGKQFALNHGIGMSRHEILAFTDDDILFPTDWVSNIGNLFEDEALDLVGGKTLIIWPESGKPRWYHPTMVAILGGVDLGDNKLIPPPSNYAPAGGNLVARRSLFDRVGVFSEAHFRHMDYEFGLRCVSSGAIVAYDPRLQVYAPVANDCLTKRYFRRWSFKAGIVGDAGMMDSSVSTFLFVPKWVYRQLFEDFVFLVTHPFGIEENVAFGHELRICRFLGIISSRWNSTFRAKGHSQWVEKYSQKKKDLY